MSVCLCVSEVVTTRPKHGRGVGGEGNCPRCPSGSLVTWRFIDAPYVARSRQNAAGAEKVGEGEQRESEQASTRSSLLPLLRTRVQVGRTAPRHAHTLVNTRHTVTRKSTARSGQRWHTNMRGDAPAAAQQQAQQRKFETGKATISRYDAAVQGRETQE